MGSFGLILWQKGTPAYEYSIRDWAQILTSCTIRFNHFYLSPSMQPHCSAAKRGILQLLCKFINWFWYPSSVANIVGFNIMNASLVTTFYVISCNLKDETRSIRNNILQFDVRLKANTRSIKYWLFYRTRTTTIVCNRKISSL